MLTLLIHDVEFTSVGGKQEIVVNANTKWEAKCEENWLSTEIIGGIGNGTIVVNVQPNFSSDERSARILVITLDRGIFEEITIFQKGESLFQVYDEFGNPLIGSMDLVGIPCRSYGLFDRPDGFPAPTSNIPECTWKITGEVKKGIMAIDFPNSDFALPPEYKSLTEDLIFSQLFIEHKNDTWTKLGLHKKGNDFNGEVYILYVGDDFSNEMVTFKRGWNFVEIITNPPGNGESFRIIGTISQTVNDFLEKGYRWCTEFWIGPL